MKWNTVFNSELHSLSTFDAKRIFKQELVKIWHKAVFNTQLIKTVFKSELYSLSTFDAKRIFKQELVKIWHKAVFNTQLIKTVFKSAFYSLRRFHANLFAFLGRIGWNLAKDSLQHKME